MLGRSQSPTVPRQRALQRVVKACKEHIAANYAPERIDALIREGLRARMTIG
jgi:hypothetical protein